MKILQYPNVVQFLRELAVLDTETVSTADDADIIEYSFSVWDRDETLENITQKYNTTQPISHGASAIHFLTNNDLLNEPFLNEHGLMLETLQGFGAKYFCGHNVGFDRRMIVNNLTRHGYEVPQSVLSAHSWIDTLRIAKKLYSQDQSFENLKLAYLWFRLGVNEKVQRKIVPHSAEDDVLMCFHVLMYMVEELIDQKLIDPNKNVGDEIIRFSTEPMNYKVMPFGKHKGMDMDEVPLNYLEWMVKNSDALDDKQVNYDPDFAHTVIHQLTNRGGL